MPNYLLLDNGLILSGDTLGNEGTPLTEEEYIALTQQNNLDHDHGDTPEQLLAAQLRYDELFIQYTIGGLDPIAFLGLRPE